MSEINEEIMLKIHQVNGWTNERITAYNNWHHQLDMLYDDIESGKFGEDAKTGSWYLWVKAIKEANPKPDNIDELRSELDELISKET